MKKWVVYIVCILAFIGCREYQVSDDPSLRLAFSADTICFDTLFTEQGSATAQLVVYNPNKNALVVDKIWMEDGEAFRANIDGEPALERLTELTIFGKDSILVFLRVTDFGPMAEEGAILIEDRLHFHLATGATQDVVLEAYAENATRLGQIGSRTEIAGDYTFTALKPYILFDTILIGGKMTMEAGARLYMHQGASLVALGDVEVKGEMDKPVLIRPDRLDYLFDSVPYLYAAGGWNGFYLQSETPRNYELSYVEVLSGNVGMSCVSTCTGTLPTLRMDGCKIHNHTLYGLVLEHVNALVTNTEISNCGLYCVYCNGGKQDFVHSTVASFFGYTNIRIQSAQKENTAAVYIDNLSKNGEPTVTSFYNSVITGYLSNQLVLATPLEQFYEGVFSHNYLRTDTLLSSNARNNTYWQNTDTAVFRNTFYKYKEYTYYDFRPDSLSPIRGIGDSIVALPYPTDREGVSRALMRPDAGCYQYHP